jgi:hypothetical protein
LRFDVGAEDGVHAGKMALAAGLEPFDHVTVEAEVNGSLAGRDYNPGGFPEIVSEGFGGLGVGARLIEAASAQALNLTERMSDDSRFLLHGCSPSGH